MTAEVDLAEDAVVSACLEDLLEDMECSLDYSIVEC